MKVPQFCIPIALFVFAFMSNARPVQAANSAPVTVINTPLPVKFTFGLEYSVVSQDVYGEQAKLVLEVIPVIPALIRRPVLGGD